MGRKLIVGVNDLATTHPSLVSEWDFEKNDLTPAGVTAGSKQKPFWKCEKGHSWQSAIYSRAGMGRGCPICSNKAVSVGVNDLATTHPEFLAEWDFEKNLVTPQELTVGSRKPVWWVCPNGHSYEMALAARTGGRTAGCPFCAGKKVLPGENDFATEFPELVSEWDFEKNALTPQEVRPRSEKPVWWLCPKGHSYETMPALRARGTGCPFCSGRLVTEGETDFATTHPEFLAEWDFEKNSLNPSAFSGGSQTKVWWLCPKGHSWKVSVNSRVGRGTGCPICSNKAVSVGVNDLATTHPEFLAEWDFEKNKPLQPTGLTAGSAVKVWWICPNAHSYESRVGGRTGRNSGCPVCAGKRIEVGYNDLATLHPELIKEWNFERNSPLLPQELTPMANRKVWWKCSEGHEWRTDPNHRLNGRGCPKCANSGYDATQKGLFYFISNSALQARKVGITNPGRTKDRVEGFGSDWVVIKTYTHENGLLVRDLETKVLRWLRKDLGLPAYLGKQEMGMTGGHTETFSMEGPTDYEVLQKIEQTFAELSQTGTETFPDRRKK